MRRKLREDEKLFWIGVIVCFLAFVAMILLSGCTRLEQIRADEAFVYPVDGEPILVLPSGEYLAPETITDGCYRVTSPGIGAAYGTVERVGETCQ